MISSKEKKISEVSCQIFNKLKRYSVNHHDEILEDDSTESRTLAEALTEIGKDREQQAISSYLFIYYLKNDVLAFALISDTRTRKRRLCCLASSLDEILNAKDMFAHVYENYVLLSKINTYMLRPYTKAFLQKAFILDIESDGVLMYSETFSNMNELDVILDKLLVSRSIKDELRAIQTILSISVRN